MTSQDNIKVLLEQRAELERGLKIAKAGFPEMIGRDEDETIASYERAIASVDAELAGARANANRP